MPLITSSDYRKWLPQVITASIFHGFVKELLLALMGTWVRNYTAYAASTEILRSRSKQKMTIVSAEFRVKQRQWNRTQGCSTLLLCFYS